MFQIVKYNLLIPFLYDSKHQYKLCEDRIALSTEVIKECVEKDDFSSMTWFQSCFRSKPLERNYQMAGSPLLIDERYKMTRVELDSIVRNRIGIHKNENVVYQLERDNITFSIPKIRLLFTNNRIGFIQVEILAKNLDESASRRMGYVFSKVTGNQPRLSYQKKISKDKSEKITISFKQLIENIVNLQAYIPINLYENRISTYMQISVIGSCESKLKYFDSLQALSQRSSTKSIDESRMYLGREPYISRFVGDRTVCIYGDTDICGSENIEFLTNVGNGLIKTATENYTTIYAFLISLRLLLANSTMAQDDLKYLLDAPLNLSEEDNIREFFDNCIWNNGWNLENQIENLRKKVQIFDIEKIQRDTEEHGRELKRQSETLKKMSDDVASVRNDVGFIADFIRTELSSFLEKEKKIFNQSLGKDDDGSIGAFVKKTSEHIDQELENPGYNDINQERKKFAALFGDKWQYVMKTSQTSLISSAVLLSRCSDITAPDFDWSGVCICCTAALEAELKRVFFDGLLDFMVTNYGEPCNENANEIYVNWPDALLSIPRYQFSSGTDGRLKRVDHFTMGNLPFLFGETGKLSTKEYIRSNQLAQSELMRKRMTEYLSTIVLDYYKEIPFEAFYIGESNGDRFTNQVGCFVWKCEQIRNKYRNKAAHVNVMTEQEAASCYQSIIAKRDTYTYNAEIAGAILELFSKIDGSKLNKSLHGKYKPVHNTSAEVKKQSSPGEYVIGQIVELGDLEVTTKGVLRGTIVGSTVGASLSKKHLSDVGVYPRQYLGKSVKVKLVRWDENGQKFNAEWL